MTVNQFVPGSAQVEELCIEQLIKNNSTTSTYVLKKYFDMPYKDKEENRKYQREWARKNSKTL